MANSESAPPDEWVRHFEADAISLATGDFLVACQHTRHPVYRDMICRGVCADRAFDGNRQFFRVTLTYYRDRDIANLSELDLMLRFKGLLPVGPDVPADWKSVP